MRGSRGGRTGASAVLSFIAFGVLILFFLVIGMQLTGGGVTSIFGFLGDETGNREVETACNDLAEKYDSRYCNTQYVAPGDCTDFQASQAPGYQNTASEEDCNFIANYSDEVNPDGFYGGMEVNIDGEIFNCMEEGYISDEICPAAE